MRLHTLLRLCLGLLGTAAAQSPTVPVPASSPASSPTSSTWWTVQVFAFSDAEVAAGVVAKLRAVGLDAYPERPQGSRLTQVRVGCFSARGDAEGVAQDVRVRVAADALVAPYTSGAGATVCVRRAPGFIPPGAWGVAARNGERITFWVGAAGRRYLTFDGRWHVAQSAAELGEARAEGGRDGALEARYRATTSRGVPLVRADLAGGSLIVAAGELLWGSARAAVVHSGEGVFSLSLVAP